MPIQIFGFEDASLLSWHYQSLVPHSAVYCKVCKCTIVCQRTVILYDHASKGMDPEVYTSYDGLTMALIRFCGRLLSVPKSDFKPPIKDNKPYENNIYLYNESFACLSGSWCWTRVVISWKKIRKDNCLLDVLFSNKEDLDASLTALFRDSKFC